MIVLGPDENNIRLRTFQLLWTEACLCANGVPGRSAEPQLRFGLEPSISTLRAGVALLPRRNLPSSTFAQGRAFLECPSFANLLRQQSSHRPIHQHLKPLETTQQFPGHRASGMATKNATCPP